MVVYTINIFIVTIFSYISRKTENKYLKNICIWIAILSMILVAGLRVGVGTDYYTYVEWFDVYSVWDIKLTDASFGYTILNRIVKLIFENSQYIFLVSGVIIYSLVYSYIKRNTYYYDLGIFMFISLAFYFSSLNIMRQWIAISICLYAQKYLNENKTMKYILCILIASTFHSTSIIMLGLLLFKYFVVSKRNVALLLTASTVFLVNLNKILIFFMEKIHLFNTSKYLKYLKTDAASAESGGFAYVILALFICVLFLFNYKKYMLNFSYSKNHVIFLILALLFSALSPINIIYSRLQFYFLPIVVIILPNIIALQKKKVRVIFIFILFILGLAYMYRSLLINGGEPLPYVSVFSI